MPSSPSRSSRESTPPRPESAAASPASTLTLPGGVDEVSELRARVAHLEQTLQEMRQRHLADLKALRQSQHLLNAILENTTAYIFVKDTAGRFLLVNRSFEKLHNRPRAEILGKTAYDLWPTEVADRLTEEDRTILSRGELMECEDELKDAAGAMRAVVSIKFPLTDAAGAIIGLCGISTDITDRKRAAEERAALAQQVIETQRAALRELSTPLIPLADGVLVVPLIGAVDATRAQQIIEILLEGVAAQRVHTAIIDITGVRVVDSTVAQALLQAAQATQLLGANIILTGLRAEVAKALVRLGAELGGIVTLSTLQAGILHALRRLGKSAG